MWFAAIIVIVAAVLFTANDRKNEKRIKQYIEGGTAPENFRMLKKTVFYMEQNSFSNSDIANMMEKYEDSIVNNSDEKSLKKFYDYAVRTVDNMDTIDSYFRFNRGIFHLLAKKEKMTNFVQNDIYGMYCLCRIYDRTELAQEIWEFVESRDDLKKLAESMKNSDADVENEKKKLETYLDKMKKKKET